MMELYVGSENTILKAFVQLFNKKKENNITNDLSKKVQLKYKNNNQSIYQLSGGNQQKVVFGRALASNPKLLLLDEPTRGVDVGAKLDIYKLIRELAQNGCGIILNSTDLSEIIGMSDRILVLKNHEQFNIVENLDVTTQDLLSNFYEEKNI